MRPDDRRLTASAVFFVIGPLLVGWCFGYDAAVGYGWAIIIALVARTIAD